MAGSALLRMLATPLSGSWMDLARVVVALSVLTMGVLLVWRAWPLSAPRLTRGRSLAAGAGLALLVGGGLFLGLLFSQAEPDASPRPGGVPVRVTPGAPASDPHHERVVPVVPQGPRRISC